MKIEGDQEYLEFLNGPDFIPVAELCSPFEMGFCDAAMLLRGTAGAGIISATGAVRPSGAPIDLLAAQVADNIQKSRAIGAVG